MAYIFQETKSIQISILDATYKITNEYLISREEAEKKNEIIGATLSDKYVVVYLYDHKERNFASLVVDRFVGTYKFNPSIGFLTKTEFLMKSFEMEVISSRLPLATSSFNSSSNSSFTCEKLLTKFSGF